ncbi:anti-sigma factor [Paenibacillus gansuensis]|uniref:Anti-sigma-W factor RsiW n=1 Tax=Paenibacillus gansuensis TaxID=306542 RepID=A0ABW5P9Q8_9BACL
MKEQHGMPCDLLELFVIEGLDEVDKAEFEKHLASCASCQEGLAELSPVMDALPYAAEQVEVPQGMKGRILGSILRTEQAEPNPETAAAISDLDDLMPKVTPERPVYEVSAKRTGWSKFLNYGLAAAALISIFYNVQLKQEISRLETIAAAPEKPVQRLQTNNVVSLNPAVEGLVAKGRASIVIDSKGTHLLVQAENLPELKQNQAFQLWLIKGGEPVNAGTFVSHNGSGAVYYTLSSKDQGYDTIAITLEPDAFGEKPRGNPVLAAKVES